MSPARIAWVVAAKIAVFGGIGGFAGVAGVAGAAEFAPISAATSGSAPKGIEAGDLDRAADPCSDFYQFATGSWRARNPIPEGQQRWSRRTAGRETNRRQLTALLEELAAKADRPRGSVEQQLGDSFAACMNEPAIDALSVTPLAPWLAEIANVQDAQGVQRMIRRLHEIAIPAPFVLTAASDYHDPESVVANIAAGGLGLPGRDDYLKPEPTFVEARAKYRTHVAKVLALSGMKALAAEKAADEILALETRLAEASLAPDAAADPAGTAHKLTFAQLKQLAKNLDWDTYFAEASLPRIDVNVAEPAFLERLDRELEATPVETWKVYLAWHLLESAAPSLSKPFADESGAAAKEPRVAACLESTEALLGESLGRVYAERYFPPAAKAKVQEMVRNLLAVLKDDLREMKWMSDPAKQEALAKIAAFDVMVGYPDAWTDTSALVIRRDAFWADVAAARHFGVEGERKRIGQRTSRAFWQLPPSSPGAYIDIQLNVMGLPAGFLQEPAFDLAASDAVNYGAIGIGIAHDLTHAIDALGREFDSTGQPRKWWTQADLDAFERIGQCTVDQYDGYAIEPGVHLEGKKVLGEALGDLAGMRLAYRALKRSMQSHPVPEIDGFSPEQQFFIAWGQFRGAAESLELQRQMVKTDAHPTAKYRVIGPLSNAPEFQQAFACKTGSAMVRPPEQRCGIW